LIRLLIPYTDLFKWNAIIPTKQQVEAIADQVFSQRHDLDVQLWFVNPIDEYRFCLSGQEMQELNMQIRVKNLEESTLCISFQDFRGQIWIRLGNINETILLLNAFHYVKPLQRGQKS
jgi:hypothetical protein